MKHGIVYSNPLHFAGWPANHGAWQWGDEFLVGFMRGPYSHSGRMHKIKEPFERVLYRSMDGGATWHDNIVNTNFNGTMVLPEKPSVLSTDCIRVCGVYDTGGDYTDEKGCFYLSTNYGFFWYGPYYFNGLELPEDQINTSRTRQLGRLLFMSAGQQSLWGTDYTFVMQHNGDKFERVGTVCEDHARAVMPAVARLDDKIYCVVRRRETIRRAGWLDCFVSSDEARTWSYHSFVDDTGSHNGNPPALLALPDESILCTYGNRDYGEMRGARLYPKSQQPRWHTFQIRPSESNSSVDIGYPQLFLRSDGTAICVYYWTSDQLPQQHIAWTEIEPDAVG
jgi:hypothetical protein